MLGVNDFDQHVAARMFDFFAEHTPWQRRLWRVSVLTVMDELLEAGEVLQHGVLSDEAVAFLADEFLELAKSDPAFVPHVHTLGQAVDAKRRWDRLRSIGLGAAPRVVSSARPCPNGGGGRLERGRKFAVLSG